MSADQDKELMKMWQESRLPPVDAGHLTEAIAERVKKFDRTVFWRNMREYVAGGGLIAAVCSRIRLIWAVGTPSRSMK